MTDANDPGSRRSRWVWEKDDIIIIKKSDEQPQTTPDRTKNEIPIPGDKANEGFQTQDDQTEEQ